MRRPSRPGLLSYCPNSGPSITNSHHSSPGDLRYCLALALFIGALPVLGQEARDHSPRHSGVAGREYHQPITHIFSSGLVDATTVGTLTPFLNDSTDSIRARAFELLYLSAVQSKDSLFRATTVDILTLAIPHEQPEIKGDLFRYLIRFAAGDFSQKARDTIRKLVPAETGFRDEVIRIAAFIDLRDLIPTLRAYALPPNPAHLRWSALVSLARMDDRGSVSELMARLRNIPVNDDVVYNIFPDLIFTRNRRVIKYLIGILHLDSNDCYAADAERNYKIPCGFRIMEQLASVIEGFPLKPDASGDLIADDYPRALKNVRQWFVDNENFRIRKDFY